MKDNIKWIILIIGFMLFAALMWGLLSFAIGGRFIQGIIAWLILIGVWAACTIVVWIFTKIPIFHNVEFFDCAKYSAILALGSAVVHTIIKSFHTQLPDWSGWIVGVVISTWACTVEYRREKNK